MVRALLTLALLSSCVVADAAPFDLDSPFKKILLLKNEKGEVERKQVKNVRLVAENYEGESQEGTKYVVAQGMVLACLPAYPEGNAEFSSQTIKRALDLLENTSLELKQSAGIGPKVMVLWDQLLSLVEDREKKADLLERKKRESESAEREKKLNQQVKEWLEEAKNYMKPRSEKELYDLKARGEALLAKTSAEGDSIREYLAVLSQVLPAEKGGPLPDLDKLKDVEQPVLPDEMLIWFAGAVYLISLFLLLFGLSYLSNIFTCIQSKLWVRAVLYSLFTPIFFAGLYYLWWPTQPPGQKVSPAMSNNFRELDVYLKSRLKPIYYLPKKELTFSKEEFMAGVLDKVRPTDKLIGYLKGQMGEGQLNIDEKHWSWKQGISVLGLPLEIPLLFEGPITDGDSWENPKIDQVRLGQLRLPPFLADYLEEAMRSTFRNALQDTGLQGLGVGCGKGGSISITVPSSGVRPVLPSSVVNKITQENLNVKKGYLKKEMSAEELAQFFVDLEGKSYEELVEIADEIKDKYIFVHGFVEAVGPTNFGITGKLSNDSHDDIYLTGIKDYYRFPQTTNTKMVLSDAGQNLCIKCQLKSDWIFMVDARGDLYVRKVAQDLEQNPKGEGGTRKKLQFYTLDGQEVTSTSIETDKEAPLVLRGKRLRFKKPFRLEINLLELKRWQEMKADPRRKAKGGPRFQVHFSDDNGDIDLYGVTIKPSEDIREAIEEVDSNYKAENN